MLVNFRTEEFVDRATFELLGIEAIKLLDERLKLTIEQIRKFYNFPMVINNWVFGGNFQNRCYRTQKSIVGSRSGSHYRGMGVDFDCYDAKKVMIPAIEMRKKIFADIDKFPYIRMIETGVNWVHVDVMDEKDSQRRIGCNDSNILIYDFVTKSSQFVNRSDLENYKEKE